MAFSVLGSRSVLVLLGLSCLLLTAHAWAQQRNLAVSPRSAGAEARLALVIGNSNYKEAPLKNPANDANDMAAALKELGFKVILRMDANQKQMKDAIRLFGDELTRNGGVGVFYFAGHGLQSRGQNYMVPIGATIEREVHIEDESVDARSVLTYMEDAQARVNVVILDACRNNPYARGTRGNVVGLAQMDARAKGTLVAFATAPGAVALDGEGRNGVYTKHILKQMREPGVPIELMFKRVRDGVMDETREQQIPWESSSLRGADFYFTPGASPFVAAAPQAPQGPSATLAAEIAFWETIKTSAEITEYEAYLQQFPNGQFVALAQARIASLKKQAQASGPIKPASSGTQVASIAPVTAVPAAPAAPSAASPAGAAAAPAATGAKGDSKWKVITIEPGTAGSPAKGSAPPASSGTASAPVSTSPAAGEGRVGASPAPPKAPRPASSEPSRPAGVKDCDVCPELVVVPGGRYTKGSTDNEPGRDPDEGPAHSVSIPKALAFGKFEVTRGQFARFVQESKFTPSIGCTTWTGKEWKNDPGKDWRNPGFPQTDQDPVVCVNWNDAKAYAQWLTRKTGKTYRLPTESEWEYAARGGTVTPFYWGVKADDGCRFANLIDQAAKKAFSTWPGAACSDGYAFTAPVGRYQANAFGLHDTAGNVWEWTEDCWNPGYVNPPQDGMAATTGDCARRVLRGGSWSNYHRLARSAHRYGSTAMSRSAFSGFRVVRSH